jgi:hypothetical protein
MPLHDVEVDNVKVHLVEIGWGDVDWIGLAHDRGRWGALMKVRVP